MQDPHRWHGFDALRAFALLLGLTLHTAFSFAPNVRFWPVADNSPSRLLAVVAYVLQGVVPPLFFFMAGFFGHQLYQRRGPAGFIRDRARKIAAGWCILAPLLVWAAIRARFDGNGAWLVWHLWFLCYLAPLYAAAVLIERVRGARIRANRLDESERRRRFTRLMNSRLQGTIISLPLGAAVYLSGGWYGLQTPANPFVPAAAPLAGYGVFFAMGWLLSRMPEALPGLSRRNGAKLLAAFILGCGPLYFGFGRAIHMGPALPHLAWKKAAYSLLYGRVCWLWVSALAGRFLVRFDRGNTAIRYLADSSYWVYLGHLPLVIFLQMAVAPLAWPWALKFVLILAGSLAVLLPSYHYLVRSTVLGGMLNSRRYARGAAGAQVEPTVAR